MLTWTDVVELTADLPGVEQSTSYGTPALKVGKKLLARYRNETDGAVVLMCGQDEKAALLAGGETGIFTEPTTTATAPFSSTSRRSLRRC